MMVDHLVGFCSFVDVPDIVGIKLNTLAEGEDRFFKFFEAGVAEADVIVDIS